MDHKEKNSNFCVKKESNLKRTTFIMKVRSDANFRSEISIGTNLHYEGKKGPESGLILNSLDTHFDASTTDSF